MSDTKPTGGPAFPRSNKAFVGMSTGELTNEQTDGMTLRDYFAGQALMSMLSTPDTIGSGTPDLAARLAHREDVARGGAMPDAMGVRRSNHASVLGQRPEDVQPRTTAHC